MSTERRTLVIVFAIALGLRVLYAAVAANQPDAVPDPHTSDLAYAEKITSGTEWITTPYSPKAPGYPALLAVLYLLGFKQLWLTMFLQAVLGALTVVVFYRMCGTVLRGPIALVAALWFAASVHHMQYTNLFTPDALVVLLLIGVLSLVIRPFERMRFALLAGGIYAWLIHADPQFVLLFPLFAVLIFFFKTRHRILGAQYFFLFVTAILVLSAPWAVRNTVVYRQAVPIALEASKFFRPFKVFVSNSDGAIAGIEGRVARASRTHRIETNTVEFWRFARLHDGRAFESASVQRPPEPAWSLRHNLISSLSYGLILPFFVFGGIEAFRKRDRAVLMVAATVVTYFLMRAYLGGSERARLPVDPLIILIAFYGIQALVSRYRPAAEPAAAVSQ